MIVATIGSCLSRRTAGRVEEASILTSVYHNRSDQLGEALAGRRRTMKYFDEVARLMSPDQGAKGEFRGDLILRNQSRDFIGRHYLAQGVPLREALAQVKFDLILVDNYMDVVARLWRLPSGERYFIKYREGFSPEGAVLTAPLTPQESAASIRRLLLTIQREQPAACIVFIHFPTNNFPGPERWAWSQEFERLLAVPKGIYEIPLRTAVKDKVPSHFKRADYEAFAEEVNRFYVEHRRKRKRSRRGTIERALRRLRRAVARIALIAATAPEFLQAAGLPLLG